MAGRRPVPTGTIVCAVPDEGCVACGRLAVHIISCTLFQERRGVDEFWVCQHCKSLNRSGTGRCYHCRQKFGSAPKPTAELNRTSGAPGPTSMPTGQLSVGPLPPYLARPTALGAPTPIDGSIG